MILAQCEMQTAMSWTRFTEYISYNNNRYAICASI